jgi:putative phage-type endonuclease
MTKTDRVPLVPDHEARVVLPASASREEWLAARRNAIGGSEISAVMGINPYATPFHVFRAKADGWFEPEFETNEAIEWGHRLEQAVIDKAVDELGLGYVARPGGQIWANPKVPYIQVTPDAFVTKRRSWSALGLIEAKTAGDDEGWTGGSAPLHYQIQLQVQLGVMGLKRGWLACFELGQARNFYLVETEFDAEWFAEAAHLAERFWIEHVQEGVAPMHDFSHPRTEKLLRELRPKVHRQSIEFDDEALEWISDYNDAKEQLKVAEARMNEAKNWLIFHMGDAGAAYIGEEKVASYPEVSSSRINAELLRERYPEIAKEVTVTSTHRRFTVAKPKTSALKRAA